ncbi:response regulator [Methanoregula sp.]|jgi:CheY-like chemotaxis protein|uniref:response regulator n=1 Tax=Methanoregula sp. TaxID=2052170 RepID=UPI0035614F76
MTKTQVLIVEDELIVAEDLKMTLSNLGYDTIGIANTGTLAIEMARSRHPDLILMDIMLAGKLDGIMTAEQISEKQDIPVIYLTAYANEAFLQRAKLTAPYGYIIKPFNDRDIYCNIEIGLFRHNMEKQIKKRDAILFAIGLGVEWFLRQFSEKHHIERNEGGRKTSDDCFSILEQLGNAMELNRVALFKVFKKPHDMYTLTMMDEWFVDTAFPLKGNLAVTELDHSRIGLDTRFFEISQGIPVTLTISDFVSKDREFFKQYNFSSLAVLPIRVQDMLYGLILFIDSSERSWSDEELEAMKISANIIGGAIGLTAAPLVTDRKSN